MVEMAEKSLKQLTKVAKRNCIRMINLRIVDRFAILDRFSSFLNNFSSSCDCAALRREEQIKMHEYVFSSWEIFSVVTVKSFSHFLRWHIVRKGNMKYTALISQSTTYGCRNGDIYLSYLYIYLSFFRLSRIFNFVISIYQFIIRELIKNETLLCVI